MTKIVISTFRFTFSSRFLNLKTAVEQNFLILLAAKNTKKDVFLDYTRHFSVRQFIQLVKTKSRRPN